MISNLRTTLALAAVAALAVPAAVVATALPASAAASCGKTASNLDSRSGSTVRMTAGTSANMRSGSSTSCAIKGWADNQDTLDYYCYTWATSTSSWTYLKNVTDGTYGWVSDSLLPNNGSTVHCGF
ncbi:SH3 domain-containing protein [Streptomyces sp. NPDC005481]|uniref:SH3 domain-containing protein n=1 Tax=Streptomyces sp. NPDC005481 TaxID=3154881 RepID=UPI0033AA7178